MSNEYVTEKILTMLGDANMVEDVEKQKMLEESERYQTAGEE